MNFLLTSLQISVLDYLHSNNILWSMFAGSTPLCAAFSSPKCFLLSLKAPVLLLSNTFSQNCKALSISENHI